MTNLRNATDEFVAHPRMAVARVARDPTQPANRIYRRLRHIEHEAFAVNPNTEEGEDDRCYAPVSEVPDHVDGVVVAPPEASAAVVEDWGLTDVPRVRLRRGMGPGSVSEEAIDACRAQGMAAIPSGCPNMFGATDHAIAVR